MKQKNQYSIFYGLLLVSLSFVFFYREGNEFYQLEEPSSLCRGNLSYREICVGNNNSSKLEDLSPPQVWDLYARLMLNIQRPKTPKFIPASNDVLLEIVLLEMKSSESIFLVPAIYNIGNVYGKEGVAFTVVHHAFHAPVLNDLKKDFKNMRLIQQAEGSNKKYFDY